MSKAKVNGVECVIYGYENEGGVVYCHCYFPSLGYRYPVLAELIEVEHE